MCYDILQSDEFEAQLSRNASAKVEGVKDGKREDQREKTQDQHLAVMNGEIKYTLKGGISPAPSFNKKDQEEVFPH